MTEQQREDILQRMLDSGSTLTDSDIDLILADDELRDIYSLSLDVNSAKRRPSEYDTAAEWDDFKKRLPARVRVTPYRLALRIAAILIGAAIGIGVWMYLIDRNSPTASPIDQPKLIAGNEPKVGSSSHDEELQVPELTAQQPNKPHKIKRLKRQATIDDANLAITIDDAELEEYLRVQQAQIDNDLALQQAEVIANQYQSFTYANAAIDGEGGSEIHPTGDANHRINPINILTIQ